MPPLPAAANVLRVDVYCGGGLDVGGLCRLHFKYTGGAPTTADCNSLATTVHNSFNTNLKALFNNTGGLGKIVVQDLGSNTGAQGINTTSAIGTRTGAYLSAGTAALINHKIARHYRGGKPRTYLPAFTATDMASPSAWVSASVTALQTGWDAFIAGIVGATSGSTTISAFANVSYYSGKTLRSTPLVETITASVVSTLPASQRRRNRP